MAMIIERRFMKCIFCSLGIKKYIRNQVAIGVLLDFSKAMLAFFLLSVHVETNSGDKNFKNVTDSDLNEVDESPIKG